MRVFGYIIVCLAASLVSTEAVGQVQVVAQVDTSQDIYVGEGFSYNIIIDGRDSPGQVDLAPLAEFHPQSTGNRDVSQTSISIINGRTTKEVIKRFVMGYQLASDSPGEITIPSVPVTIDGRVYKTNPVRLNILKAGATDRLDIEMRLSAQSCYVGQAVELTVNMYCPADIGDFRLSVPALESKDFYFEDPDFIDPQAKQFRLGADSAETVYVTQSRAEHNGRDCVLLSFTKILIPKRTGTLQLASCSISADLPVGRVRSSDFFFDNFRTQYKRFMVSSGPLVLDVLDLPAAGRPEAFYGLVGKYTISASAVPTKVNVGDPITLTIKIGGEYLKPVEWPVLEKIPQLAENFKLPAQQASPVLQDGFKLFTQTIRANNDKVTEIPSIPLAFFDPDKAAYVTVKSEPVKLDVAPTKVLTAADLEGGDFTPVNKEVEAVRKGLSANYEGPNVLQNVAFSPLATAFSPAYLFIWALPLVVLVGSSLTKALTAKDADKLEAKRRRRAASDALNSLRAVVSAGADERYELLAGAMKQYIAQRLGRAAGSLTAEDCRVLIIGSTGDDKVAGDFSRTVAACEAGRYAPVQVSIDADKIKEVAALIKAIEKKIKK